MMRMLKDRVTLPKLIELLEDFRNEPRDRFSWEEFDYLMSPMLNNPLPLFQTICDGDSISFYESFIVLVLFCKYAEFEERL